MGKPSISVSACVLSLASNVQPTQHLTAARQWLDKLGDVQFSTVTVCDNEPLGDIPVYHNQIAYVRFAQPMTYVELVKLTKHFEQQKKRGDYQKPLVTLDIDIIAIQVAHTPTKDHLDEKQQAFITFTPEANAPNWLGIARRLPLADYDRAGVSQLADKQGLGFLLHAPL